MCDCGKLFSELIKDKNLYDKEWENFIINSQIDYYYYKCHMCNRIKEYHPNKNVIICMSCSKFYCIFCQNKK